MKYRSIKNLNYWDELIANKKMCLTNYNTNCNTQRPSDTNYDLKPSIERPSDFDVLRP